jgi:hypothetical protein
MGATTTSVRLYVLLARKSSRAVIFRRGPSKQVALVSWETDRHEFRIGQWLKGRIYELRCDLSPSGERLIYFGAKYRSPHRTWTAISRPPFLTALTMWPKGDAWGGGGLFHDENTIGLNHRANERKAEGELRVPKRVSVEPLAPAPGRGEDNPIWATRLARDGWICQQGGNWKQNKHGAPVWIEYREPQVWTKTLGKWSVAMRLTGIKQQGGPWYLFDHEIIDATGKVALHSGERTGLIGRDQERCCLRKRAGSIECTWIDGLDLAALKS